MENITQTNIQYQKARKLFIERKNYIIFTIGYLLLFFTFQLNLIDYKHLNLGFTIVHRDFFFWLQGLVLILYGIYLFVPYFHKWEQRKKIELTKKFSKT